MSLLSGALLGLAVWQLINSFMCLVFEGESITYTYRMAVGYAVFALVLGWIAVLLMVF